MGAVLTLVADISTWNNEEAIENHPRPGIRDIRETERLPPSHRRPLSFPGDETSPMARMYFVRGEKQILPDLSFASCPPYNGNELIRDA